MTGGGNTGKQLGDLSTWNNNLCSRLQHWYGTDITKKVRGTPIAPCAWVGGGWGGGGGRRIPCLAGKGYRLIISGIVHAVRSDAAVYGDMLFDHLLMHYRLKLGLAERTNEPSEHCRSTTNCCGRIMAQ